MITLLENLWKNKEELFHNLQHHEGTVERIQDKDWEKENKAEFLQNGGKQKMTPKQKLAIAMLIGVLLLIISMPTKNTQEVEESKTIAVQGDFTEDPVLDEDYKKRMEQELKAILTQVEGVGDVEIMITLARSSKKIVEKDKETKDLAINEVTIFAQEEYGESPYVNQEIYPEIEGVMVAAVGGDNPVTIKNITEAIQALFGVDTHKIKIMKRKTNS